MSPWTPRRKAVVAPGVAVLAAFGLLALAAGAHGSPGLSSSPSDDLAGATPGAGGLSGVVVSRAQATDPGAATGLGVEAADWYDFGTPAQVVSRVDIPEDGVTLVTLSNGVKLNLKPTRFTADEVLVSVLIDGGLRSLASDSQPAAELGEQMFVASGVGLKTRDELIAMFGPAASSIEFTMNDPYFTLDARGRTRDLNGLLQVMSAYLTDPGWRADILEATKTAEVAAWADARKYPNLWLYVQMDGAVLGDPRWSVPTNAEIERVGIDDVRKALERQLALGAIQVTVVGDFDLEETISAVAASFGSTHSRRVPDAEPMPMPAFAKPAAEPLQVTHGGRPDRMAVEIRWPTEEMPRNSREDRILKSLMWVLAQRVAGLPAYQNAYRFGRQGPTYRGLAFEGQRGDLGDFRSDVFRIARDIATDGVSEAELDLARDGLTSGWQSRDTNMFWFISLFDMQGDPRRWAQRAAEVNQAAEISAFDSVTPAEVQEAARRYLREDLSVSGVAYPEPPTS